MEIIMENFSHGKTAAEFRKEAREALSGNMKIAVITGLIALLLGGVSGNSSIFKLNLDISERNLGLDFAGQRFFSFANGHGSLFGAALAGGMLYIVSIALIIAAAYFILGSFTGVGYAKFNLDLADRMPAAFETLFAYFSYWKTTAISKLLKTLYVFLWSLLFLIPGIVAAYSYSMTDFILAENPYLTPQEALERSKSVMYGNRGRLFCLHLSFIGWHILAALTFGIGSLWLIPYQKAAEAAFYREISMS